MDYSIDYVMRKIVFGVFLMCFTTLITSWGDV